MTTTMPRFLRIDAEDDRDRVLHAAGALFADDGLEVPTRTIGDRAGVPTTALSRPQGASTPDALSLSIVHGALEAPLG